jgi:hypothetical protein
MSNLVEVFGYASMYALGTVGVIFVGCLVISYLTRNKGMEGLAYLVWWVFGVLGISTVVGLILLGRMLA